MNKRCFASVLIVAAWPLLSGGARAAPPGSTSSSNAGAAQVTFTSRVTDAHGAPVAGAKVTLCQIDDDVATSFLKVEAIQEKTTGPDGTFAFSAPKGTQIDATKTSYFVVRKEGLALSWAVWPMKTDRRFDITLGEPKDLAGDVVDEKGQPLADAQVSVAWAMIGRANEDRYFAGAMRPGLLEVKTDRHGHFVFTDMPAEAKFALLVGKPGRATVCTLDPAGYRGEKCRFSPGQAGIRVTLPPAASLSGVVLEKAGGKPVAGVSLLALPDQYRRWVRPFGPVVSAPDGTFCLTGLDAGSYTIQLPFTTDLKAEWVAEPASVELTAGETKTDVKVLLVRGGILELLVKDPGGQPVKKAGVRLHEDRDNRYFAACTDENGLARLRLASGEYGVLGPREGGYARPERDEHVRIEEGQTQRIELVFSLAPKIAGTVRDQAGNPLAGVKLTVRTTRRDYRTTTDGSGGFVLSWDPEPAGPQNAPAILVARDEGRGLVATVDLDRQTTHLDIELTRGVTVTGTVLNHESKPLPGARLQVVLGRGYWSDEATASSDGTFEIRAVSPDRECSVTAVADGYGKQRVALGVLDPAQPRQQIGSLRLVPADLSTAGLVVDPNGRPVAGAGVYGSGEDQPDLLYACADKEGRFTLAHVCPGLIRLSVYSNDRRQMYGTARTEGGASDVRVVISGRQRPSDTSRRSAPLKNKALPPLQDLGIDLSAGMEGRILLVCFWDMSQRPSRNCIAQLTARAAQLRENGVEIVAVPAARAEDSAASQRPETDRLPFWVGTIAGDIGETRSAWGVQSLPWLILTDKKHTVVAEGIGLDDLDNLLRQQP